MKGNHLKNGRIVHITLKKCGSQWVRDVLCAAEISQCSGISYSGITFDYPTKGQFILPENTFSGPIFTMSRIEWESWKCVGDKAIVVLRDPRDQLISFLYSMLYSHGPTVFVNYVRDKLSAMACNSERITWLIGDVASFIRFYRTWEIDVKDDTYVVRYETLVQDQHAEFNKLVDWLGWKLPPDVLETVIARLSFKTRSGRNPGETDILSHYRKGLPGDWRNHFTREHGKLWENLYPGFLTSIGYENNDEWWLCLPESNVETDPNLKVNGDNTQQTNNQIELLTRRNLKLEKELVGKELEIRNLAQACRERLELIKKQDCELKILRT
ncbi:MAG: sulfotransferase domain-containing protein [Pseudomonadota bacterium]